MNRKERRKVVKSPELLKKHKQARSIIDDFMQKVEESEEEITEKLYNKMWVEKQREWILFANRNDFNVKYFHAFFKLDFKVLKAMKEYEEMSVPEVVDLCITNYRKMRDQKKAPYRKPVGPVAK